jgi:prepilin-type processing-associated H-X9-DG protein
MGGEEVDWWRHEGIANFAFVDGHVKSYHGRPRTGTSPGVYPKFAGYTFNSSGAARCSYTDPLPTP